MSSRTITAQKALELHLAFQRAMECTKCEWKGPKPGSQPKDKEPQGSKGCRHCMGHFFDRMSLTRNNLQVLEDCLADGDLKSLEWCRFAFVERLPATQTTWENGPLFVRSPGRAPIMPTKATMQEPKPKMGFKKVKKGC